MKFDIDNEKSHRCLKNIFLTCYFLSLLSIFFYLKIDEFLCSNFSHWIPSRGKRLNALKRAANLTDAGILFQNTKHESTAAVISIFLSHTIDPHPKLYRHHVEGEKREKQPVNVKLFFMFSFKFERTQHEENQDEM